MAARSESAFALPGSGLSSTVAENFSLTRGGPIYRLQLRLGAAKEQRAQIARRATVGVLLTWLPLLVLSMTEQLAFGDRVHIPFLRDFAAIVRFLIALPLLILCETAIDRRLRITVNHFVKARLVNQAVLPAFEAVIQTVTRLRDLTLPEVVILAVACLPYFTSRTPDIMTGNVSTWHFSPAGSGHALSRAGWWFVLVSMPLFRFLLLRWLWRLFLWASFLWRVSRLPLDLTPSHPDLAGGLGFLAEAQIMFGYIAFAGSAVIAGQVGNAVAYGGATVAGLKFIIIGYCALVTILVVAPLLLLSPTLFRLKKKGLLEYGILATDYTQTFDAKWVHGKPPRGERLLGSSDIQSLADIGISFARVCDMRIAPIDRATLFSLVVAAVLPMVPVLIIATPAEDLIQTVLRLLG